MSADFPQELVHALRAARRVTVLTGAGISAESGVPTFRDPQSGLWSRFRPEDLANATAFRRDPQLVWDWYEWRRRTIAAAGPNAGHLALARMETRVPEFSLITQNVDGLHARAGSKNIIELHGSIMRNRCLEEDIVGEPAAGDEERPPRCTRCGAPLRPDVVWFGESLTEKTLNDAVAAASNCQIFFSIGTSSVVNPAAQLPELALHAGAQVVEINPEPTRLSGAAHLSLRGAAGAILSRLVMATWPDAS
jgi:NAD-dependent deacetylase